MKKEDNAQKAAIDRMMAHTTSEQKNLEYRVLVGQKEIDESKICFGERDVTTELMMNAMSYSAGFTVNNIRYRLFYCEPSALGRASALLIDAAKGARIPENEIRRAAETLCEAGRPKPWSPIDDVDDEIPF